MTGEHVWSGKMTTALSVRSRLAITMLSLASLHELGFKPTIAAQFDDVSSASVGDLENAPVYSVLPPGGIDASPTVSDGDVGWSTSSACCGQPGCQGGCQGNCQGGCRGCGQCGGSSGGMFNNVLGDACPRWTIQVDALMLWQGNVPSVPLLALDNPGNPALFLTTSQIVPDMAIGPRAAVMLHLDREYAVEANYFNVGSISGTHTFTAPVPQQLVWDAVAGISQFGNIDAGTAATNGAIQSFELNWRRRHCHSNITWLAGFRWVEWNQTLTLSDVYNDGTNPTGTDLLTAATANDLYGAQIGMDAFLLNLWDKVRFNGVAKAGVYGNVASATTAVDSTRALFVPQTFTAQANQTGFFGEVGVNGSVRLTDHIWWRTGYNFFWLSGVALPSQQLAVVDASNDPATGTIDVGSSVYLHGVNTGLEVLW